MPKTVSASEAKVLFGAMADWATENEDDVIVESRGKPKVVIVPYQRYQETRRLSEAQRRHLAVERLERLAEKVRVRNRDLTSEQADALADRFAHEVIEDLIAEGKLDYRG